VSSMATTLFLIAPSACGSSRSVQPAPYHSCYFTTPCALLQLLRYRPLRPTKTTPYYNCCALLQLLLYHSLRPTQTVALLLHAPCTLCPTPYTPHPTPYALHPTPYTPQHTILRVPPRGLCTLLPPPYSPHPASAPSALTPNR